MALSRTIRVECDTCGFDEEVNENLDEKYFQQLLRLRKCPNCGLGKDD